LNLGLLAAVIAAMALLAFLGYKGLKLQNKALKMWLMIFLIGNAVIWSVVLVLIIFFT
jgi:hypothetical protein